jgi:predicted nucleic acid-binding protein
VAEKLRVVFDFNVFLLAAARQKSVAASCFELADKGRVSLFISKAVLLEIEDVLNRPGVRVLFSDLSDEIAGAFVAPTKVCAVFSECSAAVHIPT